MLNRRFIPYIVVGICILACLYVSYVGYIAYQNHVAYKAFWANPQAFNRSVEGQHEHSSHDHTHGDEDSLVALKPYHIRETGRGEFRQDHDHHLAPSGEYVYEINGIPHYSDMPMSQEAIEIRKWVLTGEMSPTVEKQLKYREMFREQEKRNVVQRVVTPDGKLHKVIVPRDVQYDEGDAVLQSELDPPFIEMAYRNRNAVYSTKLTMDGVDYYPPEEYHSISDPYEREEYFTKFAWSIELGISMAEVEKRIARGQLGSSLSEDVKRHVDEQMAMMERSKMLQPEIPSLLDKPPVKVKILSDEGPDALPGWMQKEEGNFPSLSTSAAGTYSGEDFVSERGSHEDVSGAPVRSDVPRSPSDLPGMVEPVHQDIADLQKRLTPEGVEAKLEQSVSPDHFDKAQQLIDQYGTEEGLRRLREIDPEAAWQFERERRPVPSRDVPDGEQSESGSKD